MATNRHQSEIRTSVYYSSPKYFFQHSTLLSLKNFFWYWSNQVSTWENGNEHNTSSVLTFHRSFISPTRQQSRATHFTWNSQRFSFWRGWFSQRIHNRFCEAEEGKVNLGGVEKDQATTRIYLKLSYRYMCVEKREVHKEKFTPTCCLPHIHRIWLTE